MSHRILILPYSIRDKSREKTFDSNMEKAAVICLAEANRKKPGILGSTSETVAFVSKLHYPLWVVPWENECLIVDGLGTSAATVAYEKLPDVSAFAEDLKRGSTAREQFRSALEKHAQTFKSFVETTEISFKSLIEDKKLLSTICGYVEEFHTSRAKMAGPIALLSPTLDENRALESAEEAVDLWGQVQSDIKSLQYAIDVLNKETEFHERKILREIEHIHETYDREIARVKPTVEKKVEKLSRARDRKIQSLEQKTNRTLKAKERMKEGLVRQLEKHEADKSDFQRRRDELKRKGDRVRVPRWEYKIRRCQAKITEVSKRIDVLTGHIEEIQRQSEVAIENFRKSYQALIDDENRKISELELSRNSAIETREKESEWLRSANSFILNQIDSLLERKRQHTDQLKKMAIPWKSRRLILVNLPFYLVRYETEKKSRYTVYPPVNAMSAGGIKRKIQRAIWGFSLDSRIKLLLSSRSKSLGKMLDAVLVKGMKRDNVLERKMLELASHHDIVKSPIFDKKLKKGLEALKDEGWIDSEEQRTILKMYTQPLSE